MIFKYTVHLFLQKIFHSFSHRYVGVYQSDINEEGEVRILFLKTIDGKRFIENVYDKADVQFHDIIAKLDVPKVRKEGTEIIFELSSIIDVFVIRNRV